MAGGFLDFLAGVPETTPDWLRPFGSMPNTPWQDPTLPFLPSVPLNWGANDTAGGGVSLGNPWGTAGGGVRLTGWGDTLPAEGAKNPTRARAAGEAARAARTGAPVPPTSTSGVVGTGGMSSDPELAPWAELIANTAQAAGVEPYVLGAAIKQESHGNPTVVNSIGATGLLQATPDGRGAGHAQADLQNPAYNLQLAIPDFQDAVRRVDTEGRQYGWNVDDPVERATFIIARAQRYGGDPTGRGPAAYQNPQAPANAPFRQYVRQLMQPAAPLVQGAPAAGGASASPFGGQPYDIKFGFNQAYGRAQFSGSVPQHRGIDIVPQGGGIGTPIWAVRGGTVVYSGYDAAGGHGVIVQEPSGMYNAYFHLNAPGAAVGTPVQLGGPIGQMGQSGSEGFPHLHLEVRRAINGDPPGQLIDPVQYFGLGG